MNYKNDDSLFIGVHIPINGWIEDINVWFGKNQVASIRLIQDYDAEFEFLNVEQINNFYPGVKTFTVVCNPWYRIADGYLGLKRKKEEGVDLPFFKYVKLETFEDFVKDLTNTKFENFWFNLSTPQKDWVIRNEHKVDYIIRLENVEEDLRPLKLYFLEDRSVHFYTDPLAFDYRSMYNEETKNIIRNLFLQDIEYFNYEF